MTLAAGSAFIAIRALLTSVQALHSTYRPVLRPVPLRVKATGQTNESACLLKNIGRGPAVAILVFEAGREREDVVLGEMDILEPLGAPAGADANRIGRVQLEFDRGHWLELNHSYRVLYQDIAGRWHETYFIFTDGRFTVRYLGPKRWQKWGRSIPKEARRRGHVVNATD